MDNDHTTQTRQQRRAAERLARKCPVRVLDRVAWLRLACALTEADGSISPAPIDAEGGLV